VETVAAVSILGALMVLTVAPHPASAKLRGTVYDPPTGYQGALGGSWSIALEQYRLDETVRRLVPNATYQGEQLVDCFPHHGPLEAQLMGLFHSSVNILPGWCPAVGAAGRAEIRSRNVAQLVDMATNERLDVSVLMQHLAQLDPRLVRFARLRVGIESVQVAVIDFPAAAGPQYRP
jgi:hypothetical protein